MPLGQALGQGEVRERLIPALAQRLQSPYVRPRETRNKRPRRRGNAPGPGTEEQAFDARETVPVRPGYLLNRRTRWGGHVAFITTDAIHMLFIVRFRGCLPPCVFAGDNERLT